VFLYFLDKGRLRRSRVVVRRPLSPGRSKRQANDQQGGR
jgi:hypothetical protein